MRMEAIKGERELLQKRMLHRLPADVIMVMSIPTVATDCYAVETPVQTAVASVLA